MNIVFFGSPAVSLIPLQALIEAGHEICLVITQPDRPSGRGKKVLYSPVKRFALEKNIPVYQPRRIRKAPDALEKLTAASPDVNIVVAYGQIIPNDLIYFPRYNSLNIHFSMLPKYRGASPVQWAILCSERETGITIFELNEKMDEGDIFSQKKVPILPGEKAHELEERLAVLGADLLTETLGRLDGIKGQKQNSADASYAPLIRKEHGRIDWNKGAAAIHNQIRAFSKWPSSFCFLGKQRLKIIEGLPLPEATEKGEPGEIMGISHQGLDVKCGKGSLLRIMTLQPENRKAMDAFSFSLGSRLKCSDRLD